METILMTDQPYPGKIPRLAEKNGSTADYEPEKKKFIDWYNRFDDRELLLAPGMRP